jgi:hypothetical protein
MSINEDSLRFVMNFAPIQTLLLYDANDLSQCDFKYEIPELLYVKKQFSNLDLKSIISQPFVDYRVELFHNITYFESPEYLLYSVKNLYILTERQVLILRDYLFRFTHRSSSIIEKKIARVLTCASDHLRYNISNLMNDVNFKLEPINYYTKTIFTGTQTFGNLRDSDELIRLFLCYGYVSDNIFEAKALCIGMGLNPSTFWINVIDYHNFIKYFLKKFNVVHLFGDKIKIFMDSIKVYKDNITNPCLICCENSINILHRPCNHITMCSTCANIYYKSKNTCIICRVSGTFEKVIIAS